MRLHNARRRKDGDAITDNRRVSGSGSEEYTELRRCPECRANTRAHIIYDKASGTVTVTYHDCGLHHVLPLFHA